MYSQKQLRLASQGLTLSVGGLNVPEIVKYLNSVGVITKANTKRSDLNALLLSYLDKHAEPAPPKPAVPKPESPKPAVPKPESPKQAVPKPESPKPPSPKAAVQKNVLIKKFALPNRAVQKPALPKRVKKAALPKLPPVKHPLQKPASPKQALPEPKHAKAALPKQKPSSPKQALQEPKHVEAALPKQKPTSPKQKNVILIIQSDSDSNKAFDNGDVGLQQLLGSVDEFTIIHKIIRSLFDLQYILSTLGDRKIAHLIIMAHGNNYSITLTKQDIIDDTNINVLADILSPHLERGSSIFLHSCATGGGGTDSQNIANIFSVYLPGHIIYAADKPINRGDLLVTHIAVKRGYIDIRYEVDDERVMSSGRELYRIFGFLH